MVEVELFTEAMVTNSASDVPPSMSSTSPAARLPVLLVVPVVPIVLVVVLTTMEDAPPLTVFFNVVVLTASDPISDTVATDVSEELAV
jgi:hypothetical protein